jgi:hypothetical protein
MLSADGHKDPSLGLLYFASEFFYKWEMWTSHIWWRKRIQRMQIFRALVRTLKHQKRLQCELVVSQHLATSGQQPHNNPADLGSHVPDQIPWSSQPEQNQEKYCYFH